jgi:hypothetical protein
MRWNLYGLPWWVWYALFATVYLTLLGALSWPLRSYRSVLLVTLAAAAGSAAVALARLYVYHDSITQKWHLLMFGLLLANVASWLMTYIPLHITVYSRRQYWPVYPPGYCKKCGYDLRGLPLPRCPECGTPFDPAALPEPGDGEESTP